MNVEDAGKKYCPNPETSRRKRPKAYDRKLEEVKKIKRGGSKKNKHAPTKDYSLSWDIQKMSTEELQYLARIATTEIIGKAETSSAVPTPIHADIDLSIVDHIKSENLSDRPLHCLYPTRPLSLQYYYNDNNSDELLSLPKILPPAAAAMTASAANNKSEPAATILGHGGSENNQTATISG